MFEIKINNENNFSSSKYQIVMLEKKENFSVDFVEFESPEYSILFVSPYQNVVWIGDSINGKKNISFHADFYCIEYHKKEVACNGVLFNNIYQVPYVETGKNVYEEIEIIFDKIKIEMLSENPFSQAVIKTYLQLILAICSREKSKTLEFNLLNKMFDEKILQFRDVLNKNFIKEKKITFYAEYFKLPLPLFSKKIKQQFGKTPSELIQERTVLEAKKLLHLTYKSIKEIAFELNFEDEFYFSRYFKKAVGISPSYYRKTVGISIVAR